MVSSSPSTSDPDRKAVSPGPQRLAALDRLIVALDVPSAAEAVRLVDRLDGTCRWVKVGMELYYAAGNSIVEQMVDRGLRVFLDLKIHDIPNTAAAAVRSVAGSGASLLTVHAGGGGPMMRAAAEACAAPGSPRLLAVTVLTSLDAGILRSVGIGGSEPAGDPVRAQVLRLAKLAADAGIDGLVCSAQEVSAVRETLGLGPLLVVPGIRPAAAGEQAEDDQRRTATPGDALAGGASMLVVGRPITQTADPAAAASRILSEIQSAL